jgi:Ser/Thr protein kinase RdoA (MazF antagonist)
MSVTQGRFSERAMWRAMLDVAEQIDADIDEARLLRLTNNAVYALPAEGVVIRVTRSQGLQTRVDKVVALARWLQEVEGPANRLVPAVEQPVRTGELLATIWEYLPGDGQAPTVTDLGRVLRTFHSLGEPPFQLPAWDPVGDAHRRLADAEDLPDADREFLLDWCERLAPRVADLNDRADRGLVHGDAHAGNLLRDRNGDAVLCDFDPTCDGPWQVDLVAVAVGEARFGRAGAHKQLAALYGYDVTTDPDWPLLREARELKMVVAAVPLLASTPGIATEFDTRLQSIRRDDHSACWTPFADLRHR